MGQQHPLATSFSHSCRQSTVFFRLWRGNKTMGWNCLVLVTSQQSRGRNFLGFRNRECPVGRQWLGPGHVSTVLPILFSNQCLTVKPICPPRPSPSRSPSQLTKIDQMSLSAWHLSYSLEKRSLFGFPIESFNSGVPG